MRLARPILMRWPDGVLTSILYESTSRYDLAELADGLGLNGGTEFSRLEVLSFKPQPFFVENGDGLATAPLLSGEEVEQLAQRAEAARAALEAWIRRAMKPGLHYGTFPVDGKDAEKPTLLKPGAELVALLYGWRFAFTADLDTLQMNGPQMAGTFAYVCHVIDAEGRTVGQGRGVAELRESGMQNTNKTVKIAEKRAMVDAVLRCAGLSQWFTQDLEEAAFIAQEARPAPEAQSTASATTGNGSKLTLAVGRRCKPEQCAAIRIWLQRTGRAETEIIAHYEVSRLEDLSVAVADRLLRRLQELHRERPR